MIICLSAAQNTMPCQVVSFLTLSTSSSLMSHMALPQTVRNNHKVCVPHMHACVHALQAQVWNVSPVWNTGEAQQLFTMDNAGPEGAAMRHMPSNGVYHAQ